MPKGMAIDDDHYMLDDAGNRVLVGLDLKETHKFETLDKFFSVTDLMSPPSSDDRRSPKEQQRWLVLHEKHQAALKPFLRITKTKH
jgi:hypothetical protein